MTETAKNALRLTLVQTHLHWEDSKANLHHFDQLLATAEESDLILLPEMFSTGFSMQSELLAETMEGPTVSWMAEKAKALNTTLCGSVIIKENASYYNRLIWMRPDQSLATYNKRHLFRLANEHKHYDAGTEKLIVELAGFRICPMICYDLRFPVWSRNTDSYDLAIYLANWPAPRRHHWQALLGARAIENLCYVVGLNRIGEDGKQLEYAGDSLIYDFKGEKLLHLDSTESVKSIRLELDPLNQHRKDYPFHEDADGFHLHN